MAKSNLKVIYSEVEEVKATKGDKSLWPNQPFKHKFDGGVRMLGVMNDGRYRLKKGSLVIKSLTGKQLWKNFEYKNEEDKKEVTKEAFLDNPPMQLIVLGANPPRKLRRKRSGVGYERKRRFKVGRSGSKHRPVVYTTKDRRWKVSPKAHIAKRGAFVNPLGETLMIVGGNPMHYQFYRRKGNPVRVGIQGLTQVQKWLPIALWGGLSAIATGTVPAMFRLTTPWMKAGGQLATAFLGGMLVSQIPMKGRSEASIAWTTVGASLVLYDFLKGFVFPTFLPGVPIGEAEYHSYDEAMRADSQSVGQYPEVEAYPEEVSAYPEEVSSYPYDGNYPY